MHYLVGHLLTQSQEWISSLAISLNSYNETVYCRKFLDHLFLLFCGLFQYRPLAELTFLLDYANALEVLIKPLSFATSRLSQKGVRFVGKLTQRLTARMPPGLVNLPCLGSL